jgi:hypothetical protein
MTIITSTPYASFFDRLKMHEADLQMKHVPQVYLQHTIEESLFTKSKRFTRISLTKTKEFFAKPEVKVGSLVAYWATETLVTALGIYAFASMGMYVPAVFSFAILIYLTYATFGVINEVKL